MWFWAELAKIFLDIAREQGAFVALTVIIFIFFGWLLVWLIKYILKSKEVEIDRIAEERDKLQDILFRHRVSTREEIKKEKEDHKP